LALLILLALGVALSWGHWLRLVSVAYILIVLSFFVGLLNSVPIPSPLIAAVFEEIGKVIVIYKTQSVRKLDIVRVGALFGSLEGLLKVANVDGAFSLLGSPTDITAYVVYGVYFIVMHSLYALLLFKNLRDKVLLYPLPAIAAHLFVNYNLMDFNN
jgi:hypothetical protein